MSCMMSLDRTYRALAGGMGMGMDKRRRYIINQRSSVNASRAAFYLKTIGVDVDGKYEGLH